MANLPEVGWSPWGAVFQGRSLDGEPPGGLRFVVRRGLSLQVMVMQTSRRFDWHGSASFFNDAKNAKDAKKMLDLLGVLGS